MTRSKTKTGWEGMGDFGESDLLILGSDGDDAHYVPMTEPEEVKDQFSNPKASVVVVVCGEGEILDPAEWRCAERQMGKREFRAYKALAQNREGKVMLILHRSGESGSLKTRYSVRSVLELEPNQVAACQALLADYQKESK